MAVQTGGVTLRGCLGLGRSTSTDTMIRRPVYGIVVGLGLDWQCRVLRHIAQLYA